MLSTEVNNSYLLGCVGINHAEDWDLLRQTLDLQGVSSRP